MLIKAILIVIFIVGILMLSIFTTRTVVDINGEPSEEGAKKVRMFFYWLTVIFVFLMTVMICS